MYRLSDIQESFAHLVGWEQSYNMSERISDSLTQSESGLTFQGAHPLVTLNNIASVMPDDYIMSYPLWDKDTFYDKDTKVRTADGEVYIALESNTNVTPSDNPQAWQSYNMLSDFLSTILSNGIAQTVTQFITMKALKNETRNIFERKAWFDGAARLQATIQPRGEIVGMEIVPVRAMGVTMKIESIGLQMIGGTGTVRLYLFHSSMVNPVKVIDLEFTSTAGGFQWFDMKDLYLPYIGTNDAGGAWFLCYNQNELPEGMRALNVSKDWSREPCGTCNIGSVETWRELTKYMQVSPFGIHAPLDFREYPEMFDITKVVYTNTMNYGINCKVSVGCDLTDFFVNQKELFANVLQKQVAVNVLKLIAMNPDVRVNRNQVNVTRDEILYQIEGNQTGRANGLLYELQQAYRSLSIDTTGIDRICLGCSNKGVNYRTV